MPYIAVSPFRWILIVLHSCLIRWPLSWMWPCKSPATLLSTMGWPCWTLCQRRRSQLCQEQVAIFANSGIYVFFDADAGNPAPAQFDAIQAYIRPDDLGPRWRVAGQGAAEQLIPDGCRLCVPITVCQVKIWLNLWRVTPRTTSIMFRVFACENLRCQRSLFSSRRLDGEKTIWPFPAPKLFWMRFLSAKGVGKDRGVYSLDTVVKPGIGGGSSCGFSMVSTICGNFHTTKLLGKKR